MAVVFTRYPLFGLRGISMKPSSLMSDFMIVSSHATMRSPEEGRVRHLIVAADSRSTAVCNLKKRCFLNLIIMRTVILPTVPSVLRYSGKRPSFCTSFMGAWGRIPARQRKKRQRERMAEQGKASAPAPVATGVEEGPEELAVLLRHVILFESH